VSGRIAADRWENELVPLIEEMGKAIQQASICGLGRSVPFPLRTVIKFFPDDVASHLAHPDSAAANPIEGAASPEPPFPSSAPTDHRKENHP